MRKVGVACLHVRGKGAHAHLEQALLALGELVGQQLEEVLELLVLGRQDDAAHMGEALEVLERHGGEVHDVEARLVRRVRLRDGADDDLEQVRLAGLGGAEDERVAAVEVEERLALVLVVRVVVDAEGDLAGRRRLLLRHLDELRQGRQADAWKALDALLGAVCVDMPDDGVELRERPGAAAAASALVDGCALAREGDLEEAELVHPVVVDALGPAAVSRLEELEGLVVAHLQVRAARLLDLSRQGRLEDLVGILPRLHLEAELEARVGPDLLVYLAGRLLRGEDEVNAQRTADARRADELGHELGLVGLELGELVDHDDEVRQGRWGLARLVAADVVADMVDLRLGEKPLTALELGFDGLERALDLAPVDVGDGSGKVRQIAQLVGHAAALEVDDHERDLVGMEQRGNREDIGLENLGLARAGRAGHKPVGAVGLVVKVERDHAALAHADRRGEGAAHVAFRPPRAEVEIVGGDDAEHLEHRDAAGQAALERDLLAIHGRERAGKALGVLKRYGLVGESRSARGVGGVYELALRIRALEPRDAAAPQRQQRRLRLKEHEGAPEARRLVDEAAQRVVLDAALVEHEDDDALPVLGNVPLAGLLPGRQQLVEMLEDDVSALRVACDVARAEPLVLDVRKKPCPCDLPRMLGLDHDVDLAVRLVLT